MFATVAYSSTLLTLYLAGVASNYSNEFKWALTPKTSYTHRHHFRNISLNYPPWLRGIWMVPNKCVWLIVEQLNVLINFFDKMLEKCVSHILLPVKAQ